MTTRKWTAGLFLFCVFLSQKGYADLASREIAYYGKDFYIDKSANFANVDIISKLQAILRGTHQPLSGTFDQISKNCSSNDCYRHISLGYDRARSFLMGVFYLVKEDAGYGVRDVYCGGVKSASQFKVNPPGPNQIPEGSVLNTEHTWPQSKFSSAFEKELQKSDLHHLYPSDSEMNSVRGNFDFGDVEKDEKILKCKGAHIGRLGGSHVFQPPAEHKGNVARSIFYFSIRYDLRVGTVQEATLRRWNNEDPVDEEELRRNDEIMKVQGNRNPFVDYPELVNMIADF